LQATGSRASAALYHAKMRDALSSSRATECTVVRRGRRGEGCCLVAAGAVLRRYQQQARNFGLPANTPRGSGFGIDSKTASSSRQIQFSLKLIY